MAEVLPGFETPIYGYDGVYPGPTIRARADREVVVTQRNRLSFESNVHLHGGSVPAGHDGHPRRREARLEEPPPVVAPDRGRRRFVRGVGRW